MRVLFLTRYPVAGASSRYRVFQYIPALRSMGITCDVQSFMDDDLYALSFSSGKGLRKAWTTAGAVLRRIRAVLAAGQYDIVYMQRALLPFGPPVLERWLKAKGARLVFDYDDALFINKPSRYNALSTWLRSGERTYDIFALSDCVVAGNDYLRDVAARHARQAVTVEVAEDTDRIAMRAPHRNAGPLTIGWLGSTSTVKYLGLIADVLRVIQRRYPHVELEVVGGAGFDLDGVNIRHTPWSLDGELEALRRFDIGIMPLPLEEWSKGKSGGKARTYMAAGIPAVCTRIGYNTELIRHGETGMLCEIAAEWQDALIALIEQPELRQCLADAARADVIRRFDLHGQAAKLATVFHCLKNDTSIYDHIDFHQQRAAVPNP